MSGCRRSAPAEIMHSIPEEDTAGSNADEQAPLGADLPPSQHSSLGGPARGQNGQLGASGQAPALRVAKSARADQFVAEDWRYVLLYSFRKGAKRAA